MSSLLGGLTPATFLRDHWQKRPLLIRQALPGFAGIVDRDALFGLATRADATSRLVARASAPPRRPLGAPRRPASTGSTRAHAAGEPLDAARARRREPGARRLGAARATSRSSRRRASTTSWSATPRPAARSGRTTISYDVFLLQGPGRRRWQVSARAAARHRSDGRDQGAAPTSRAEEEWLLEPGDMLYLPPGVAHFGVAEEACFTYSIGFLAPSHRDLVRASSAISARRCRRRSIRTRCYEDPDLQPPRDPLALGDAMVDRRERGARRASAGIAPPSRSSSGAF